MGEYCKSVKCPWYEDGVCKSHNDHTKKADGHIECDCDRDCGKCDLAQDRDWLLSVYDGALELLKEQEPVEPILKREGRNKYYNYYVCPRCDEEVVFDQNYCSECGAKFMWEGR